ncbi:uncharacterized protein EI97DRAFT_81529 [Westerdykella ornata]|uniref:4Fe-4S ferredoxin-type domain-containing protein n=1 Tax=Westerdykella ornata TaxID=318751 RepID=A0A6A6JK12_WESOR|nr:uncharacterized protein EI97DRAFT_81529 [Westerdykella ornata]KAF2275219.1 hypothetical protein EI97DRAFT_81529 [Westerdykella ornata]
MFTQLISLGLMATTALAASGAFSPVHHFGAMHPRDSLGKRQNGYYPSTSYCGPGDTCEESCGPTYKTCPSKEDLYCFDPTIGEQCCPDLSGNSCDEGYYCTNDPEGVTYCCPNDLDLSNCAAAYSLTVSLIRATSTAAGTYSTAGPGTTSSLIHVSSVPTKYPTASYSPSVPTRNASYTGPSVPEYTGAAAKVAGAGMAVLAGAAGIAGLL